MNRHCCLQYLFLLVFVGCYQMMVADTSHRIAQLRTNHIAHEKDQESGYDDRHARWYDDQSLNFLQTDPHADKYPSLSPYNYVARNPIIAIDRSGKDLIVVGSVSNSEITRIKLSGDDKYYKVKEEAFQAANERYLKDNTGYNTILSIIHLRQQKEQGLGNDLILEQTGYSIGVTGSMREGNNNMGDVKININADFEDGSVYSTSVFDGVAGGFGNGAPENGNYSLNNYQDRSRSGWYSSGMNRDGIGFSYNLNPHFSTGRTALRFHPDGIMKVQKDV